LTKTQVHGLERARLKLKRRKNIADSFGVRIARERGISLFMNKDKSLKIRVSGKLKEVLKVVADSQWMGPSELVRDAILDYLQRNFPEKLREAGRYVPEPNTKRRRREYPRPAEMLPSMSVTLENGPPAPTNGCAQILDNHDQGKDLHLDRLAP
jgi:hypothetical protein